MACVSSPSVGSAIDIGPARRLDTSIHLHTHAGRSLLLVRCVQIHTTRWMHISEAYVYIYICMYVTHAYGYLRMCGPVYMAQSGSVLSLQQGGGL